jgi:hypothetical protein
MLCSNQIAILGGVRSAFRARLLNYLYDQTSHDYSAPYFILFNKLHFIFRQCRTKRAGVWGLQPPVLPKFRGFAKA